MKRFLVVMAFCSAIFCATAFAADQAPPQKIKIDLNKGTVQGNYSRGDVRMAGTMQAPPRARRQINRYSNNRKYYSTPRGRYQMARGFHRRISSNYGNLNQ